MGHGCTYGIDKDRILIAFPTSETGYIESINGGYGPSYDTPILLVVKEGHMDIFNAEGAEKINFCTLSYLPFGYGGENLFSQIVGDGCLRFAEGMFILKQDKMWYMMRPYSKELYEHPTDMVTLENSVETPSIYRIYREFSFSDSVFNDVVNFIKRMKKE